MKLNNKILYSAAAVLVAVSLGLMKNARKSPYFNAGMDRAYRL